MIPPTPILVIITMGVFSAFFLWKASHWQIDRQSIWCCAIASLLHLISVISVVIQPITLTSRIIEILTSYSALLWSANAFNILLNGEAYQPVWKHRYFKYMCALSLTMIILTIQQPNNLGVVNDGNIYEPTPLFFIARFIHYGITVWLLRYNRQIIKQSLVNVAEPAVLLRRKTLLWSTRIAIYGVCGTACLNLIYAILSGQLSFDPLNTAYRASMLITFFLVAAGVIGSHTLFTLLARPIEWQQELKLSYLVNQLRTIIRSDRTYPIYSGIPKTVSLLIEVSDLARIVWTHNQVDTSITPEQDALHFHTLIQDNITYYTAGIYTPPQTVLTDSLAHYLEVADKLYDLQTHSTPKHQLLRERGEA